MSYSTQFLGKVVEVTVDRPMGSKHPEHDLNYPINYGFIQGVMAPDGEELDAYILGVYQVVYSFKGRCIAVVHRHDDEDDKLVVVPEDSQVQFTDEEIMAAIEFQEKYFDSELIR